MFKNQLEKLKFLVDELQLALYLTIQLTDPFVTRTLARHILIRAENFIVHARALRKPLGSNGYKIKSFHQTKETYASSFEEYFKISRHRLSAHVQDLDFGKRIELWNDIEIEKSQYLVGGALEIYRSLKSLNLPGYTIYAAPSELIEPQLLEALNQYQINININARLEIASDSLALTRNNTIAGLNNTAVHSRAAQLALIRRWINIQRELLEQLSTHTGIARILKARIITDIVSFCDCLVTRQVDPDALQNMEGLDNLITASGQSSEAIAAFVSASNFQELLKPARDLRNTTGSHIETNDAYTISDLIANLDTYDLEAGLLFYDLACAAFTKTCRSIAFLAIYATDGQRISGVSSTTSQAVAFFNEEEASPPPSPVPDSVNDEEAYRKNLRYWLYGDDVLKEDARQFYWKAFGHSEVIEIIDEIEHLDGGQRFSKHELRKPHQFISKIISDGVPDDVFEGVIKLILANKNGWPYPMAEILLRHSRSATVYRKWLICQALGEIGSEPHASAQVFLKSCANSKIWPLRLQAVLASFKSFIKNEGVFRMNHGGLKKSEYATLVDPLISSMSEPERLVCLLAFASILSGPDFGSFAKPFQENYLALQIQIEVLCVTFLTEEDKASKVATLSQLIKSCDYVGVSVLIAIDLKSRNLHPVLYKYLLESCCNHSIVTANHDQAWRHYAMCFLLQENLPAAHEIIEWLASKNPESSDFRILAAEIQVDILGNEDIVTQEIANIRRLFKLTPELVARLDAIEAKNERKRPD
jgi:hypothetical protein